MKKFKRYLVTSALPYANGPVHIGHLAGVYIPSDIYTRYLRLRIGIAHHERNVGDLQLEHVVDGIATAAADTRNHDDRRRQLRNFKIDYIFYVRHILNLLRFSHSFHYDRRGPKPIRPRR